MSCVFYCEKNFIEKSARKMASCFPRIRTQAVISQCCHNNNGKVANCIQAQLSGNKQKQFF